MTAVYENPLLLLFVGVVIESILIAALIGTQKKLWLVPIAVVLLCLVGLVVVERLVVTEREQVECTLDAITSALEANDLEAILPHLSKSAGISRSRAAWAMQRIKINSAKISGLQITVNELTSPASAQAVFSGVVKFDDRKKEYPYQIYAAKFEVELRKEAGRWKVAGHRELPAGGL